MIWTLADRPRLMALSFALKLFGVGNGIVLIGGACFAVGLTETRQSESLLVLFGAFVTLLALVLLFIRFKSPRGKLLLLAPTLVYLAPGLEAQLAVLGVGPLLILEAFRGEARLCQAQAFFVRGEVLTLMGLASTFWDLRVALVLSAAGYLQALWGCHSWRRRIQVVLTSLDDDEGAGNSTTMLPKARPDSSRRNA